MARRGPLSWRGSGLPEAPDLRLWVVAVLEVMNGATIEALDLQDPDTPEVRRIEAPVVPVGRDGVRVAPGVLKLCLGVFVFAVVTDILRPRRVGDIHESHPERGKRDYHDLPTVPHRHE